jgi:hypothetical protein
MNPAQPDYAFIVTVGLACAIALSIAVVVLMQIRPRFSLHNLRIAFSVVCGIACLLLIALWMRSYRLNEILFRLDPGNQVTTLGSANGDFYLVRMIVLPNKLGPPQPPRVPHGWRYDCVPLADNVRRSFKFIRVPNGFSLYLPFWLFAATTTAFGTIPWLHWPKRFSARLMARRLGTTRGAATSANPAAAEAARVPRRMPPFPSRLRWCC